ncbi:MAG TPA: hypothetical protein VGN17_12400 [Bryobacteraceae bacterium]
MAKKKAAEETTEAAAPVAAAPAPKKVKIPKLAPKNKARLPRREKKAKKKAAAK